MANFISGIISLAISAVVLASVYVQVIKNQTQCFATNCTAGLAESQRFTAAESVMWGLLTLVAIVGLLYGVLNVFGIA